jgi:hypothetical protein
MVAINELAEIFGSFALTDEFAQTTAQAKGV